MFPELFNIIRFDSNEQVVDVCNDNHPQFVATAFLEEYEYTNV